MSTDRKEHGIMIELDDGRTVPSWLVLALVCVGQFHGRARRIDCERGAALHPA